MSKHLTTETALRLINIGHAVQILAATLPLLDLDAIPTENRTGLLCSLDDLHDQIHHIKQLSQPTPHDH